MIEHSYFKHLCTVPHLSTLSSVMLEWGVPVPPLPTLSWSLIRVWCLIDGGPVLCIHQSTSIFHLWMFKEQEDGIGEMVNRNSQRSRRDDERCKMILSEHSPINPQRCRGVIWQVWASILFDSSLNLVLWTFKDVDECFSISILTQQSIS